MDIATDKYRPLNTVKILHDFFSFQNKTCHVNHAFFYNSFFQTFVDGYWPFRVYTQLTVLTS